MSLLSATARKCPCRRTTSIAAAKESQKIVRNLTLDQREQIISKIRQRTHENAELIARMGVDETGMGNVGDKILKHHLVADGEVGLNTWKRILNIG